MLEVVKLNFAGLIEADDIIETNEPDKWKITQFLVEFLRDRGKIDHENFPEINDSIMAREKSMSTGIGDGVAIPHCSSIAVDEPKVVMAVSRNGMDFDAIDKKPVHFIILLVVPKNKFQMHISTLAEIAKLMNDDAFREKLLASPDSNAMYQLIQENPLD